MPNRLKPPRFRERLYRKCNLVDRFFNKLKHFRAVATRYDKRDDNYLACRWSKPRPYCKRYIRIVEGALAMSPLLLVCFTLLLMGASFASDSVVNRSISHRPAGPGGVSILYMAFM
jgi:hypothetical protein